MRIVPTEFIEPGEELIRDIDITLSNSTTRHSNGYGSSGLIFDTQGNIMATYSLTENDTNGDGTRTYNEIEITAVQSLFPSTP